MIAALVEARRRGLATIALVGYDGGRIAAESLADFVIVVRSEHIPRIQEAQASAYHTAGGAGLRVRARVTGVVQGVGFRPFVYGLATELGLAGFVLNDARGVTVEVEGAAVDDVPGAPARGRAAAGRRSSRCVCEPIPETGERGLRHPAEPARRAARRADRARHRRPATPAWPSSSTRSTAATATRSSTAPTAGRGSRSSPASRTTGRGRRWPASSCARPARPSTTTRATAASTRSRTRARRAGRSVDAGYEAAVAALLRRRDRGGQGHRRLPPRVPRRRRGGGGAAARPQAPRGPAVRADGPRRRDAARSSRSTPDARSRARARRS